MEHFKLIKKVAEELGWIVTSDSSCITFERYTPQNQDFTITFNKEDIKDIYDFHSNLSDKYDNFDVCEETYLWLDSSGHGKNGAPHDMMDVYKDMQCCEELLEELVNKIYEAIEILEDEEENENE